MTPAPAPRIRSFCATALLVAACGSPPADVPPDSITPPPVPPDGPAPIDSAIDPCANPDGDGDGHAALACGGDDCDDASAAVFPGATEGALRFAADIPSIPGHEGLDLDAKTDAVGTTHVAYNWRATGGTQERLRYLKITAAGTVLDNHDAHTDGSSISSHVGRGISLAVDSQNRPHVTFFDQWNTGAVTFFHGIRAAGSWTFTSPDADQDTAIAIDAEDTVHAVTSGLRYVTNAGGTFVASDLAGGYQPAIAVAPDGSIHVVFSTTDGVRHATKSASGWTIESVEDFATNVNHPGVQAAFDANGVLHAVYRAGNGDLTYARNAGAGWTYQPIATASLTPPKSLLVLPDGTIGTVFIEWLEGQGNTLMLAFRGTTGWRITDSIACGCADAALVQRGEEIGVVFEAGGNLALGAFSVPDGIDNDCDGTAW
jgi:hypothetical protein